MKRGTRTGIFWWRPCFRKQNTGFSDERSAEVTDCLTALFSPETDGESKLAAFCQLNDLAGAEYKGRFKTNFEQEGVIELELEIEGEEPRRWQIVQGSAPQPSAEGLGASYKSSPEKVAELRQALADFVTERLNDEEQGPVLAMTFLAAIVERFQDIPADDVFWQDQANPARSASDQEIKQKFFAGMDKETFLSLDAGSLDKDTLSGLVDVLILRNGSHIDVSLAQLYCQQNGIDYEGRIGFGHSHFFIKGLDPAYIEGDGNCFFYCLDYIATHPEQVDLGNHD